MKDRFKDYLEEEGYSVITPSGYPSTVYDYLNRIDKVLEIEELTWEDLPDHIDRIVDDYDTGGIHESIGNESHRAVINALKRFQDFCHK